MHRVVSVSYLSTGADLTATIGVRRRGYRLHLILVGRKRDTTICRCDRWSFQTFLIRQVDLSQLIGGGSVHTYIFLGEAHYEHAYRLKTSEDSHTQLFPLQRGGNAPW